MPTARPSVALLHLHNSCLESRGSLLIAARQPPGVVDRRAATISRSRLRAALRRRDRPAR